MINRVSNKHLSITFERYTGPKKPIKKVGKNNNIKNSIKEIIEEINPSTSLLDFRSKNVITENINAVLEEKIIPMLENSKLTCKQLAKLLKEFL